jgi:N-acetylglucosamine kinase-like BadF-type ATPase
MTSAVLLAVDGGNSKTDVVLVRGDGTPLAMVRGPLSSPHKIGVDGAMDVLEDLVARAARDAGLGGSGPIADIGALVLAGADLPEEVIALDAAASARGWARRVAVRNDTYALLRMGAPAGWGVAVVCGAGINCVGVGPDGTHARFPALGRISGDWGGGEDIGLEALWAAARAQDGRGPATVLAQRVPAYFGFDAPDALAAAIHGGAVPRTRLVELVPVVLAAAAEDAVARALVERLAAEIVALAGVAIDRLGLGGDAVDVVLGGGVIRARDARLEGAIERGLAARAPAARMVIADGAPVIGAALMALDMLGGADGAEERLRRELEHHVRNNGHG